MSYKKIINYTLSARVVSNLVDIKLELKDIEEKYLLHKNGQYVFLYKVVQDGIQVCIGAGFKENPFSMATGLMQHEFFCIFKQATNRMRIVINLKLLKNEYGFIWENDDMSLTVTISMSKKACKMIKPQRKKVGNRKTDLYSGSESSISDRNRTTISVEVPRTVQWAAAYPYRAF